MCLLVLAALAPFRRTVFIETQRGDQGGLQAHDTCPARPGMQQDATIVDEHWQAVHLQFEQTTTNTPRADWQSEATAHVSLEAVRQVPERTYSSPDLLCASRNMTSPQPETSTSRQPIICHLISARTSSTTRRWTVFI